MPFTQAEIDSAIDITCRFHGVTPEQLGVAVPRMGRDLLAMRESRWLRFWCWLKWRIGRWP